MEELRLLVETFIDFQKDRIRLGNRLQGVFEGQKETKKDGKIEEKRSEEKKPEEKSEQEKFFEELEHDAHNFEKRIENEIKKALKGNELYTKYLSQQRGIGPMMSAYLIAWLGVDREIKMQGIIRKLEEGIYEQKKKKETKTIDLPPYAKVLEENLKDKYIRVWMPPVMTVGDHPSDICKYCGLAPKSRLVHGQKISYNPRLKTLMWKILKQLMMARGYWFEIYKQKKADYGKRCPEPEKGTKKLKVHLTTKNIVMRMFMTNLWLVYRHLNKMPKSRPYPTLIGHEVEPPFIETSEGVEYLTWIDPDLYKGWNNR